MRLTSRIGERMADNGLKLETDMLELRYVVGEPSYFTSLASFVGRQMQSLGVRLVALTNSDASNTEIREEKAQ